MLPTRAHAGDAGLDLYSCEAAHIGPGERWSVGTGIAVEIPEGHAGLVLPRSGLARDHGISLPNSPGLIDSGYRGEVRVLLLNTDPAETFRGQGRRSDRPAGGRPDRARRAGRGRAARRDRPRRRRLWLQRPLIARSVGVAQFVESGRGPGWSLQVDRALQHDAGGAAGDARRLDHPDRDAGDLPRHPPRPAGPREQLLPALDDPRLPGRLQRPHRQPRAPRRHLRPGADLQPRLRHLHGRLAAAGGRLDDAVAPAPPT